MNEAVARLWRRDIIPDFRPPQGLRVGLSPLSTSFTELATALAHLRQILEDGARAAAAPQPEGRSVPRAAGFRRPAGRSRRSRSRFPQRAGPPGRARACLGEIPQRKTAVSPIPPGRPCA